MAQKMVAMRQGHLIGQTTRPVMWDDMRQMLLDRWVLDGRKGILQARSVLKHLDYFTGWQAQAITTDQVTAYAARRRQQGAAPRTVNLELAVLRRGFTLAKESGRLESIPIIHRLAPGPARTGTVETGDLEAILAQLHPRYRAVVRFLYLTGWRESEALNLTWQRVDLKAREVRLDTSKSGAPRLLHYPSESELSTLLGQLWSARRAISPFVFPGRAGKRLDRSALQKAWRAACLTVGVPKALIHDLRRTMVRDMRRAGVPLAVAMGSVGHASLQVHQGYSVVAPQDLEAGLERVEALRAGEPVQRRLVQIERKRHE